MMEKLEELRQQRSQLQQQANSQLAFLSGKIELYEELLGINQEEETEEEVK